MDLNVLTELYNELSARVREHADISLRRIPTFVTIRSGRGIITRQLDQSMEEMTHVNDAAVHHKHLSRIHFRKPSLTKLNFEDNQMGKGGTGDLLTDMVVSEYIPVPRVAVRVGESIRLATQNDELFLR